MTTPFDFVKSITQTKQNMFKDENIDTKQYKPFIVNRALSLYPDCLFFANEINMKRHIDLDMQYEYYLNSIRPMKRYAKWLKRMDDTEDLELVKQYFCYNDKKAKQALSILSNSDLEKIKEKMQKGG